MEQFEGGVEEAERGVGESGGGEERGVMAEAQDEDFCVGLLEVGWGCA